MVVPVRDIGNKLFFTSAISTIYLNITLQAPVEMDIDNFNIRNDNNYKEVRRHTISSKMNMSRTVSMSLSEALEDYTTRLEQLNDSLDKEVVKNPINSSQLSYANVGETDNSVSEILTLGLQRNNMAVTRTQPLIGKLV